MLSSNKGQKSFFSHGNVSLGPGQLKTINLSNVTIPIDIFDYMRKQELRSVKVTIRAAVSSYSTTFSTGSVIIDARYSPRIIKFKAIRVKDSTGIT